MSKIRKRQYEEINSFSEKIDLIDRSGNRIKIPRRLSGNYGKIQDMPPHTVVGGVKPGHHPTTQKEEWRKLLLDKATTRYLKSNMETAHQIVCVNQVSCSFLGFCLMAHLTNPAYVKEITGHTWKEIASNSDNWMKTWLPMKEIGLKYTSGAGGMPHIGMMLDVLFTKKKLSFTPTYLPIRGINDNMYNTDIVPRGKKYLEAMYLIEENIKKLIDQHGQIIINIQGHTRCFIGYDSKHFIAYDSYNSNLKQLRVIHDVNKIMDWDISFKKDPIDLNQVYNNDNIYDVTIGGISLVDKHWACAFMRDVAYFNSSDVKRRKTYKLKF